MVEQKIAIDCPQSLCFEISQNYEERLQWDPFPDSYRFLNGSEVKPGLQLSVKARNGFEMVVEYISYSPPFAASIMMVSGPWFIGQFAGTWAFKKNDENQCVATFKYGIKGAPRLLEYPISYFLNRSFRQHSRKRLAALKEYAESKHNKAVKMDAQGAARLLT